MEILVIGTGSIGTRHLKVLNSIPVVKPLALPLRPERRAELTQAGYCVCESISGAVARGVRLAIIATDTRRHLADTQAALQAGMDVLVEKPMATDAHQAQMICLAARQAARQVFVGCNFRFCESLKTFQAAMPSLGNIHSVRIECQSYLPDWRPERPYKQTYSAREGEGGVLHDLIHEIDFAGWLFGWPRAVLARLRNIGRLGIAADETADLLWETSAGAVVSISLDYLSRPSRRQMCARGEHGTLEWDALAGKVTLSLVGVPMQEIISTQSRDDMYLAQSQAFIRSLQGSSDLGLATGEDGVKALALCDTARRASESHCEESVAYP